MAFMQTTVGMLRSALGPRASLLAFVLAMLACSGCVRSETRDGAQERASKPPSAPRTGGAIEGRILHPAHAAQANTIPAMRICAIGSGAPEQAKRVCVRTRAGQAAYRIDGLPADDYIVVAHASDHSPLYRVGGHMRQMQCIRAPCPSMPATVTVGEGARIAGVDLNEFFAAREDFPALPER
jgi:hypothetical protein